MKKVTIVGCGNMGSALARGLSNSSSLKLFDQHLEKSQALATQLKDAVFAKTLEEALQDADFVILAIKPKDFLRMAKEMASLLKPETRIVSVLAGVSYAQLREKLPAPIIVRAMPNLAVGCGKGVTGFVEDTQISEAARKEISLLFQSTGMVLWVNESKIDALMALTACAPAFIAYLVEAFTEGGIYSGFPADQALPLVRRVFEGTLALMEEQQMHPAALRWQVASPGGTTIEGLKVLEEYRVHFAIMQALNASAEKSKNML